MEPDNKEMLNHQACRWYARLRAPDCSDAERCSFQTWLAASPAHESAWRSAVQTADFVSRQLHVDPRLQALATAALNDSAAGEATDNLSDDQCEVIAAKRAHPRSWPKVWQYAAALVLGAGLVAMMAAGFNERRAASNPMQSFANHDLREQRLTLDDGSIVYLDVGAELTVLMSKGERHLELERGRAYFEVAHDKSRPFTVTAAGTRTVALGTRFEVDIADSHVNVTLAQGSVAVTDSTSVSGWREMLSPGQQLTVSRIADQRDKSTVDAAAVVSWSTGKLVFSGMPLQQVLEEVNRYASVKVRLGDTELANIPIGGNFVAGGDSNEFVETLTAVLPLSSIRTGANEIVLFKRHETGGP